MTSAAPSQSPDLSSSFRFPPEYHFPAFYTPQPNLTTHHAQLTKWSSLILSYARHHRLFKLSLSSASESDLFSNRRINRRLGLADIRQVIDFMRKDGRAEYAGGDKNRDGGDVVYVYWKKPEEWAALVEAYVEDTAQKGSVLTIYELTDGEGTRGTGNVIPVPSVVVAMFIVEPGA
ncbi:vacuolar protein-sorting-associated protein [Metarhizium rileyi]|uniref:Vacuolar protein-sorting-associated protein 25 n=1 Tax=Metarhizium rileyi (strain RCEF 4871) TaxID=1649241 RepID=A0A167KLA8_METRR|nr:vacuolar protein-sorting-associated protein [Metarhizium rileyi RCEF 4871]